MSTGISVGVAVAATAAIKPADIRFVVLVDMDCFYCQVEEKLQPELSGQPVAVVQHNEWQGGGIIAVNYAARAAGVTRHMRGEQAQQACPDLRLVRVPVAHGKADLSRYREAGKEVAAVLQTFTPLVERASVDEAYMDITRNVRERCRQMGRGEFVIEPHMLHGTYPHGYDSIGPFVQHVSKHTQQNGDDHSDADDDDEAASDSIANNDVRLLVAATIATDIRTAVKQRTGYDCSAGIAHNKILAKLMCGQNKPNKQTLLPLDRVALLFETLPVRSIRGLGGKFGDEVTERLGVKTMAELGRIELSALQRHFDEKNALFLYNIGRGHDAEPVKVRMVAQNIGSSKRFRGIAAIKGVATLRHWLGVLAAEICERIEQYASENQQRPASLTVSFAQANAAPGGKSELSSSRTVPLSERAQTDAEQLAADALDVIRRNTVKFFRAGQTGSSVEAGEPPSVLNNAIRFLGISVGKFQAVGTGDDTNTIRSMFSVQANKQQQQKRLSAESDRRPQTVEVHTVDQDEVLDGGTSGESAAMDSSDRHQPTVESNANPKITTPSSNDITTFFSTKPKASLSHQTASNCTTDTDHPELDPAYLEDTLEEPPAENEPAKPSFFAARPPNTVDDKCPPKPHSTPFFTKRLPTDTSTPAAVTPDATAATANSASPIAEIVTEAPNERPAANKMPAYMLEYAEFQAPAAPPTIADAQQQHSEVATTIETQSPAAQHSIHPASALAYERCTTCNRKVALHDLQTHADAHFAYRLSQEQRLEYRSQIVANASMTAGPSPGRSASKPPAAKRMKTSPGLAPAVAASSTGALRSADGALLRRFLVQAPDTAADGIDRVPCTECGQRVPVAEALEHADYHAARRLQREWNAPSEATVSSAAGRKGGAGKLTKVPSVRRFFTQSQNQ